MASMGRYGMSWTWTQVLLLAPLRAPGKGIPHGESGSHLNELLRWTSGCSVGNREVSLRSYGLGKPGALKETPTLLLNVLCA